MCYHFSNKETVEEYLNRMERMNSVMGQLDFDFYYTNGFNHTRLPVVTQEKPNEVQFFNWGLIPRWAKNRSGAFILRKQTLNARSETLFEKPSFRASILTKRCLVPATGFFEWRAIEGKKFPYHIQVKDERVKGKHRPFHFGGIYDTWVDKDGGEVYNTFSIITTPANELLEVIHNTKNRMPLVLRREDEQAWLSPRLNEEQVKKLMQPYPNDLMDAYTINKLITSRSENPNQERVLLPEAYAGVESKLPTNTPVTLF